MGRRIAWHWMGVTSLMLGCGGGDQLAGAPVAPEPGDSKAGEAKPAPSAAPVEGGTPEPPPPPPPSLPTECAGEGKPCVPPSDFVDRLCRGKYSGVALVMFEKSAPWKHLYVKPAQGVDASNTIGGPTGDTRLQFGEEVLVLRQFGDGTDGVQVSGSGGFHVLRWDGTCSTLSEHELVSYQPGVVRHAPFVWKYLDPPIQEALLEDPQIAKAREAHRKQCKGVSAARADRACQKAAAGLCTAIVNRLRRGAKLPLPEKLP